MLNNEKMADNNEFIINHLCNDTEEDAKEYIKIAIEEYEKDGCVPALISSCEQYIKARGLNSFLDIIEKQYDFELMTIFKTNNSTKKANH